MRDNAALALGLSEDRRAVAPLASRLGDGAPRVRARAASALGMIEDRSAVAPLSRTLSDSSPEVREQAAWAITGVLDDADSDAIDTGELAEQLGAPIRKRAR